jgi:two-component system, OmpR family, response regulator
MRILVVEDDRKTAEFIRNALTETGFAVDVVYDGKDALATLAAGSFDAVVLDVMLPGCDGLTVVRQLRSHGDKIPVLLLSARGSVEERVEGLNAGADDYLPKPYALQELLARVRALHRRGSETRDVILRVADLSLDTTTRIAHRGQRKIELTNREFRLLEYLMRSGGRICGRMMIIEKVWEYNFDPGTNVVDVYVRKLREKIEEPGEAKLLHSVRGAGYMIKEP